MWDNLCHPSNRTYSAPQPKLVCVPTAILFYNSSKFSLSFNISKTRLNRLPGAFKKIVHSHHYLVNGLTRKNPNVR